MTQIGNAPTVTGAVAPTLENSSLGVSAETTGATSQSASTTTYYTRAPDGELLGERTPTGNYYYVQDANGSVVALTGPSPSSAVADTYTYEPYGMTTGSTGTVPNIFGFDGGVQLPNSPGLYHFGARLYDPLTGSWTQPDPDYDPADAASNSLYQFADGDPVNSVDPTGDYTISSSCLSNFAAGPLGGLIEGIFGTPCHITFSRSFTDWLAKKAGTLGGAEAGAFIGAALCAPAGAAGPYGILLGLLCTGLSTADAYEEVRTLEAAVARHDCISIEEGFPVLAVDGGSGCRNQ
jgi:RHS repeat-associated protein